MTLHNQCNQYGWLDHNALCSHEYIVPELGKLLKGKSGKLLDIGCGNGFTAGFCSELGFEVVGIDVSQDGIEIAKKAYPRVHFEVASINDDLADLINDVDVVISSEVIEHLYTPIHLIKNAFSVLKPGGILIITTPYHGYLKNLAISLFNKWDFHHTVSWDGGHIKFFSEKTLSKLIIEAGFINLSFHNVGRVQWLWKSMVCKALKPI